MNRKLIAVATLFVSFSTVSAFAETWQGTVSDSMCARKHVNATKDDVACVESCIKGGDHAVLIVGDKIYKISNQDAVKNHLGHKVTVSGTLNGDTIQIDKVTM
jgi:hypothetical protein